jgi:alpha-D-ribose 1-methylphosphonate 5-triphosphate synthase subunit PhnL
MIDKSLRIGDLIEVPPVRTVIRLEEGRTQSESIAASFVFTEEVASHFSVLAEALLEDRGKGFFLQGDFGSGKSHFLASLTAWLSDSPGSVVLSESHRGLGRIKAAGRKILAVDISLVNYRATTPLERIIIEAVEATLISHGIKTRLTPLAAFLDYFKTLLKTEKLADAFATILRPC